MIIAFSYGINMKKQSCVHCTLLTPEQPASVC